MSDSAPTPTPKFEIGLEVELRPEDAAFTGTSGVIRDRAWAPHQNAWLYVVKFGSVEITVTENRLTESPEEAVPDGWQGTEPAEGTRRHLIWSTLTRALERRVIGPVTAEDCQHSALPLANAVEDALAGDTHVEKAAEEGMGC